MYSCVCTCSFTCCKVCLYVDEPLLYLLTCVLKCSFQCISSYNFIAIIVVVIVVVRIQSSLISKSSPMAGGGIISFTLYWTLPSSRSSSSFISLYFLNFFSCSFSCGLVSPFFNRLMLCFLPLLGVHKLQTSRWSYHVSRIPFFLPFYIYIIRYLKYAYEKYNFSSLLQNIRFFCVFSFVLLMVCAWVSSFPRKGKEGKQ